MNKLNSYLPGKIIIVFSLLFLLCILPGTNSESQAGTPVLPVNIPDQPADAPGYCPSGGGDTTYEHLTRMRLWPRPLDAYILSLPVWINNPTGCEAGEPCPEYDDSPEYVNVWIDWNRDQVWDDTEKVLDEDLTGYLAINYFGTMDALNIFSEPPGTTTEPTYMRATLGWDHDPNDPCEAPWTWGDVVDQAAHFYPPAILDFTVAGLGTEGGEPTTGSVVRLEAVMDIPAGYELTSCAWIGDLTAGMGDLSNNCRYEYTPATGAGPAVATYGQKDITFSATYRYIATDIHGFMTRDFNYKVFFDKTGDDDGDGEPNWFEYWADDGAVDGMDSPSVVYGSSCPAGRICYGGWSSSTDNITIKDAAANIHYSSGISVPSGTDCPGGNFGGAQGIDSVAEVLIHEGNHKAVYHNWDSSVGSDCDDKDGPWGGCTDDDTPSPHDRPGDDLPNLYETNVLGTATDTVDSCDLETYKHSIYADYGDNEMDCLVVSDGATGNANHDWANPGKQTSSPYLAHLPGTVDAVDSSGKSGPAGPLAPITNSPVRISASLASIVGNYVSGGIDTDGDSDYNILRVSVDVQVDVAGEYYLLAWLEDAATATPIVWASTSVPNSTGTHSIYLDFDGLLIRESGLDGPYKLTRVELLYAEYDELLDAVDYPYTTAQYSYTHFDLPAVWFISSFSDYGVDSDSDGQYNLLRVNTGVYVQHAGKYTISGELAGSGVIATASTTLVLGPGSHIIPLNFDGFTIFTSRLNGPYTLKSLSLTGTTGQVIDFISTGPTTQPYTYSQFEHNQVSIQSISFDDQGFDPDGDGDYDYLHVSFSVNLGQSGVFRVLAALRDKDGETISKLDFLADLSSNENSVDLYFPGGDIAKHKVDGPYEVASLTLFGGDGELLDFMHRAHVAHDYGYADFAPPLVTLSGGYSDYGIDNDGDGLYGKLAINISVIPGDAGVIFAMAHLVDGKGNDLGWVKGYAYLEEGKAGIVTLLFDGGLILATGQDGPYELRNLYVYHSGDPSQGVYVPEPHSTDPYKYDDFEDLDFSLFLPIILD